MWIVNVNCESDKVIQCSDYGRNAKSLNIRLVIIYKSISIYVRLIKFVFFLSMPVSLVL